MSHSRYASTQRGIRYFLAIILCLLFGYSLPALASPGPGYYFGFTPFPYDSTPEAYQKTRRIIVPNSNLYALHFDDCVPWSEDPGKYKFPAKLENKWRDDARGIPPGHAVYVGLAPLAKDRKSFAPSCDGNASWLKSAHFDDPRVISAYTNYSRKAIETFSPTFLNIGIEAGELISRDMRRWKEFERFYFAVFDQLKKEYPNVKIGMSFGLQSLQKPAHARAAKAVVEKSDYLGLSFYPYASAFGEKFGDPALGKHPDSWRKSLDWVTHYTDRPIAIAETGFSTRNIDIPRFGLHMKGNEDWQAQYIDDLFHTVRTQHFLFVVWFLAVDYDDLYKRMVDTPGNDVNLLWRNVGLFDGKLQPKKGWEEWQRMNALGIDSPPPQQSPSAPGIAPTPVTPPVAAAVRPAIHLGFTSANELPQCDPNSRVDWQPSGGKDGEASMRWQYDYHRKDWKWCVKTLPTRSYTDAEAIGLWIKASRQGRLFVQVEERGGEAFFSTVDVGVDWQRIEIPLDSLQTDPAKQQDGRLDKSQLSKLLLADFDDSQRAEGQQTIWLSSLDFMQSASKAPAVKSAESREGHALGFTAASQLPSCAVNGETAIVDTPQGKVMRWRYPRRAGDWQWCLKDLAPGSLSGSSTLHFRIRSDHSEPLFFQFEEQGGEAFFTLLHPEDAWQNLDIALSELQVDPQKAQDGKLDPAKIVKWLIADAQGEISGDGTRTVMFGDLNAK